MQIEKRNGAYRITVSCGYDILGKQIRYRTTYTPDPLTKTGKAKKDSVIKKEVEDYAREFERKVLSGEIGDGTNMLFCEYAEKYKKEYASLELSPTTYASYSHIIDTRLLPALGHMKMGDIKTLKLQEHFNAALTSEKWAASTIRKDIRLLSSMFQQAVHWGVVKNNPVRNVTLPKQVHKEKVQCFTLDQAQRFLEYIETPYKSMYTEHTRIINNTPYKVTAYEEEHRISLQLVLFFNLALYGGCRRGELIGLTWDDIDFQTGIINIDKATVKVGSKMITKDPKNSTSIRRINVPDNVIDIARRWKREQLKIQLQLGNTWQGNNYVFTQADGRQMYPDTPYNAFKRCITRYNAMADDDSMKLPNIPLHGLRHTSATLLISQNTDIKTVSKRLGHSQTSTTINIYAHSLEKMDVEASKTLDNLLNPKVIGRFSE